MRIESVVVHVVAVRHGEAYLGPRRDGSAPGDDGYERRPPWRSMYSSRFETVLVEVRDDAGTVGWGEALAPVGPQVVAAVLDTMLIPALLATPVAGPRAAWAFLRDLMRERGHLVGHQADALAALDMALWDLHARRLGVPLSTALGGRVRDRVPVYISGLPEPQRDARAALARDWWERGATTVKLHGGHGVAEDLADVDAVKTAAPGLAVAVDAHWAYGAADAARLARELAARDAAFLEAPLAPEDIEGHRGLVAGSEITIAVGEALRHRHEFLAWLAARAMGLAQPDVARTGVTEALVIAGIAAAHHTPVALHHSVCLAPALAAGIHLSAVLAEALFFEYQPTTVDVAESMTAAPFERDPSGFSVPGGPGLGIVVDPGWVAHHCVQSSTHHRSDAS